MRNSSGSLSKVLCLLAIVALLVTTAATADCRKVAKLYETVPLEQRPGGSLVYLVSFFDLDDAQWLTAAGQTREFGGPWQACVWAWQDAQPSSGPPLETLPSLDATRNSSAGYVAMIPLPYWLLAAGYSYDTSGYKKPIVWTRSENDTSWTSQQLPTFAGDEGEVISGCGVSGTVLVGSSTAYAGVERAAIWTPSGPTAWASHMLLHFAADEAGRALDGFVSAASETTVCGWARTTGGDTTAVVWTRGTGPWIWTSLPLLPGGNQGMAVSILGEESNDLVGEEGDDIVGWSEDSTGGRRAVRWYRDGTWHVEELAGLTGFDQSVAAGVTLTGEEGHDIYAVGQSFDPGDPVGTVWLLGEEANDLARDVNDLIVGDNSPAVTGLSHATLMAPGVLTIAANSIPNPTGTYGITQSSAPQAHLLIETEIVPAMGSYSGIVLLTVLLGTLAVLRLLKRRSSKSL
jgi:hypothetical protein